MPYKNKNDFLRYNRLRRKRLYKNDSEYRKKVLESNRAFKDNQKLSEFSEILNASKVRYTEQKILKDTRRKSLVDSLIELSNFRQNAM